MDDLTSLRAISPLDGRYSAQLSSLTDYFSEFGLFRYRLHIEIEYLIELSSVGLSQMPPISKEDIDTLRSLVNDFSIDDAIAIKAHEKITNHDVKALEYFMRDKLSGLELGHIIPWIHFALTSQDINNTAIPLSLKAFFKNTYLPEIQNLIINLQNLGNSWIHIAMLARTHGQPASPTLLGKEIAVFAQRLNRQIRRLATFEFEGKFGGATGNFNAHHAAFPEINWPEFADVFLNRIGLTRQQVTTQVENYDSLAEIFDIVTRINTILLDLARDMWSYISFNYFQIALKHGEVGSSAMPHKVNPIDFENAEGNIGLSNALLQHMATKLPVSRLQRDLSDSTVLRSIGVPMGHALLAIQGISKGLSKCIPNHAQISADLEANAVVLAEAYQVILRREGVPDGYEILKALTRNNERPTLAIMHSIVNQLPVSEAVKSEMHALSPFSYVGVLPDSLKR